MYSLFKYLKTFARASFEILRKKKLLKRNPGLRPARLRSGAQRPLIYNRRITDF
jgi:hypothetical protein